MRRIQNRMGWTDKITMLWTKHTNEKSIRIEWPVILQLRPIQYLNNHTLHQSQTPIWLRAVSSSTPTPIEAQVEGLRKETRTYHRFSSHGLAPLLESTTVPRIHGNKSTERTRLLQVLIPLCSSQAV